MIGVKRFEDLDIYKLAVHLRRDVVKLTAQGNASHDYKFVSQIRDASRGGPRNIAEGFTRFAPTEFRQFLSYAKASLDETKCHVDDGHESEYFTDDDRDRLHELIRRTIGGINRLMRYLESPAARRAYEAILRKRGVEAPSRIRKKQKRAREPRTREPRTENREPENREPENQT
jgi:four helix bundle protein